MSVKSKVLAVAAALTVAGRAEHGGGAVGQRRYPAVRQVRPDLQQGVRHGGQPGLHRERVPRIPHAGVPTTLQRTSDSNPDGDMIIPDGDLFLHFYAEGMVSAAANTHYGSDEAVQVEYAPYGVPTGLCAAIATSAPYENEGLTLQKCSTPGIDRVRDRHPRLNRTGLLPHRAGLDHGLRPPVRDGVPGQGRPGPPAAPADQGPAPGRGQDKRARRPALGFRQSRGAVSPLFPVTSNRAAAIRTKQRCPRYAARSQPS